MFASGRQKPAFATPAIASVNVRADVDALTFTERTEWVVLIRGFEIDTDCTHTSGFTTKGFGVCIGPPEVLHSSQPDKIQIQFTATQRVEAARLPMRRRPEKYTVRCRIHYMLVGLRSGHVTRSTKQTIVRTPGGMNQPLHAVPRRISVQGQPGHTWAAIGLTGFNIQLNPNKKWFGGRYLRDFWVHNRDCAYNSTTGRMEFVNDAGFSNRSLLAYETETTCATSFALLQASDL